MSHGAHECTFSTGVSGFAGRLPELSGPHPDQGRVHGRCGRDRRQRRETYRYMDFDQIEEYQDAAKTVAA